MFLPAYLPGVFYFFYLMFLFDWAAPLNDIQLFSFFNTAPVWHLFVICYLITFWFMFFKNQIVLFYFLVPFLGQFFFLNSSFSIEHVLFFSNTNPLLNNSLNYLHPLIMNTLYVASLLSLILPFWFFISIIPVRESILAPLPLLRQFYSLTLCLLLALVFGTFWAAQLDTWGGWWVWDSSEILLIQFLLVLIVGFHAWPKYFCFSWFCLPYGFFFLLFSLLRLYFYRSDTYASYIYSCTISFF
uniref:Heme lyase n=1 Tax=Euplotes crassus TaxID=5936 RepID=D1LDR4_EUPCR|nr:heme lyase [Moneuplotes crassus]